MEITHFTKTDQSLEPATGSQVIDQPNTGTGRRYRQRFAIHLPTGGHAETIRFQDGCALRVRPVHHQFNAVASNAPEKAQTQSVDGGKGVRVTLPFPRLVTDIRYHSNISPQGNITRLFRTDGDVTADKPTLSHTHEMLEAGALRGRELSPAKAGTSDHSTVILSERDRNLATGAAIRNEAEHEKIAKNLAAGLAGTLTDPQLPKGNLGLIDQRFVVRLTGNHGDLTLDNNAIHTLQLTTGPENLRMGLQLPDSNEPQYLPGTFSLYQARQLDTEFRDLLQRLIQLELDSLPPGPNGQPPVLPATLAMEMLVESDAPLTLDISQLKISYLLHRQSLPDGQSKQVLNFDPQRMSSQQLHFAIPGQIRIEQAELILNGQLGKPIPQAVSTTQQTSSQNDVQTSVADQVIRLDADQCWAGSLILETPLLCNGLLLTVTSLSPNSRLRVTLNQDADDAPDTEVLASAILKLSPGDRQSRRRVQLERSLLLQPGPLWIKVTQLEGRSLWHLLPSDQGSIRQIHNVTSSGSYQNSHRSSPTQGFRVAASLLARKDSAAGNAQTAPTIRLNHQPLTTENRDGELHCNLAPALEDALSLSNTLIPMKVDIHGSVKGPLTVYAPQILYDLE